MEPEKSRRSRNRPKRWPANDKPKETSSKGRVHIVAEGENGYSIAVNHKVDVEQADQNQQNQSHRSRPGTKLIIPDVKPRVAPDAMIARRAGHSASAHDPLRPGGGGHHAVSTTVDAAGTGSVFQPQAPLRVDGGAGLLRGRGDDPLPLVAEDFAMDLSARVPSAVCCFLPWVGERNKGASRGQPVRNFTCNRPFSAVGVCQACHRADAGGLVCPTRA